MNNYSYMFYLDKLTELSVSMFDWQGLSETVDARYMEMGLFSQGRMIYFNDEVMGDLVLRMTTQGGFDVYHNPIKRRAYADNGYNRVLDENNSVIIYNNFLKQNSFYDMQYYAMRLWELDNIIAVNCNAQKTPILVQGTEQQRLSLENTYMQYRGNQPVIFADNNLDLGGIKVLRTDAPYIADRIYTLKTNIWNEALTALGISNANVNKKERLITEEVSRSQGGTVASRYSRLEMRRKACKEINKMFGTDIWCDFREDFQQVGVPLDENENGTESTGEVIPAKGGV
jgi:hypothetical protein